MSSSVFEMCRCCGDFDLPWKKKLISIFCPEIHEKVVKNIKNMFIQCWEIKIAENDGLPQHLCPACFSKLDAYLSLRAFCRKKQDHFNTIFKKMSLEREEERLVSKVLTDNQQESEITIHEKDDTHEGTEKTIISKKKKQFKTKSKTKSPKPKEHQNNDSKFKDTYKLKNIEFVAIQNPPHTEDTFVNSKMDDCNELDTIETAGNEEYMDYLQAMDESNSQEILKQLNCDNANDHEKQATLNKQQVFQKETGCEVLLEGEMSQSEIDKYAGDDLYEQPNNLENENSSDDEVYDEKELYQTEINKKPSYRKLVANPLVCKFCCYDVDIDTISVNDVVFETEEALNAHIKLKHDSNFPYTCPICKKTYRALTTCRQHIFIEHKKKRTICWICGLEMNTPHIPHHIARCHTEADFECEICGKQFKNISVEKFRYHKRWHLEHKQHKCQMCEKVFVSSCHLRTHMLVHTRDYFIKCNKCGKGFRTKFDKDMHLHRTHGDPLPIKCRFCEERFTRYEDRMKHMIELHDYVPNLIDEKIKCLKCNKEFRRETGFRKHMKIDCQKDRQNMPKRKYIQKKKIFVPKPKNYSCHQCSRLFGKESALLKHIPLHSNKGRPFQCDVCQLYYKTQSHLEIHKRLKHSDEKPFTCDTCGKRFAYKFSLNEHNKFHEVKARKQKLLEKLAVTEQDNNVLDSLDKS